MKLVYDPNSSPRDILFDLGETNGCELTNPFLQDTDSFTLDHFDAIRATPYAPVETAEPSEYTYGKIRYQIGKFAVRSEANKITEEASPAGRDSRLVKVLVYLARGAAGWRVTDLQAPGVTAYGGMRKAK